MKRIQVVSIEKVGKVARANTYRVTLHDKRGQWGILVEYHTVFGDRRDLIKRLRNYEEYEVSKHVENGGKLRLV